MIKKELMKVSFDGFIFIVTLLVFRLCNNSDDNDNLGSKAEGWKLGTIPTQIQI